MKKLFLYLSLFIIVFFAAYLFSRQFWSANENVLRPKESTEELTTIPDDDVFSPGLSEIIETGNEILETDLLVSAKENQENKEQYIVGIKNGYVIVYLNDTNSVYEYTGIDAELIRLLQNDVYESLKNQMYFDDKEQLFRFLESIAS